MFNRPARSYDVDESIVEAILQDESNPLKHIACLVPDGAKVLDIGAGNGVLARVIGKIRTGVAIDGIELDVYAANIARRYYRNFHIGHAQDFAEAIRVEAYDFVVLADVIEHIPDPLEFMQNLCGALSGRTKIVLSIPNVAFASVRVALLKGNFDYVDSGLLERTHLRFFTLKTIKELTRNLGMNVEHLLYLRRDIRASATGLADTGICCQYEIFRDDLAWVYQFLLVLTKEQVKTTECYCGCVPEYSLPRYLIYRLCARVRLFLGMETPHE